jgi:hypothetical protein
MARAVRVLRAVLCTRRKKKRSASEVVRPGTFERAFLGFQRSRSGADNHIGNRVLTPRATSRPVDIFGLLRRWRGALSANLPQAVIKLVSHPFDAADAATDERVRAL